MSKMSPINATANAYPNFSMTRFIHTFLSSFQTGYIIFFSRCVFVSCMKYIIRV